MAQMSANNNIPIASTTECGGDSNHLAVHFDYNAFELSWQPGVYVYTFRLEGYINRMEPFTLLTLWNVGKYGVVEAESLYSSVPDELEAHFDLFFDSTGLIVIEVLTGKRLEPRPVIPHNV